MIEMPEPFAGYYSGTKIPKAELEKPCMLCVHGANPARSKRIFKNFIEKSMKN